MMKINDIPRPFFLLIMEILMVMLIWM